MNRFNHILGHENVIASLSRAIKNESISHAYIFEGEEGTGKKTIAKAFAKALNCESTASMPCFSSFANGETVPIGNAGLLSAAQCLSCRVFESGNHPDIFFITGTNKQSIGTEDVRTQIIQPMQVKSFRYKYKIFIIPEAQTLTPAAQNALLKTIEEPAAYGIFIFLTTHDTLLPTVVSRCTVYRLKPLPEELVRQSLTHIPVEQARFIARFAGGSIGKARELAVSADFTAMRELSVDVMASAREADVLDLMALYRRFEKLKDTVGTLLDVLYMVISEMIIAGETPAQAASAVIRAKQNLRNNGNFQLTIEMMLFELGAKNFSRENITMYASKAHTG